MGGLHWSYVKLLRLKSESSGRSNNYREKFDRDKATKKTDCCDLTHPCSEYTGSFSLVLNNRPSLTIRPTSSKSLSRVWRNFRIFNLLSLASSILLNSWTPLFNSRSCLQCWKFIIIDELRYNNYMCHSVDVPLERFDERLQIPGVLSSALVRPFANVSKPARDSESVRCCTRQKACKNVLKLRRR